MAYEFLSKSNPTAKISLQKYYLLLIYPNIVFKSHETDRLNKNPNADLDQLRVQWLIEALADSQFSSQAITQLERLLEEMPAVANCEAINQFIATGPKAQVEQICRLRWKALGTNSWTVVINDCRSLNSRLDLNDPRDLRRRSNLTLESLEYTAWHRDEDCLRYSAECVKEFSENLNSDAVDSIELVIRAADQFHATKKRPRWANLIPDIRIQSIAKRRSAWLPVANEMSESLKSSIKLLDHLCQKCPATMSILSDALSECHADDHMLSNGYQAIRGLVAGFFESILITNNIDLRLSVIKFCCFHNISLRDFGTAATSMQKTFVDEDWSTAMMNDLPSRVLFQFFKLAESAK